MTEVHGDQALKKASIYQIFKKVKAGESTSDQRHNNPKKTQRTADLITALEAAIAKDRRLTIAELAATTGAATDTFFRALTDDLGLVKKLFIHWDNNLCKPQPLSRTGWPPGTSRSFPTRPLPWNLHQRISSYSQR